MHYSLTILLLSFDISLGSLWFLPLFSLLIVLNAQHRSWILVAYFYFLFCFHFLLLKYYIDIVILIKHFLVQQLGYMRLFEF